MMGSPLILLTLARCLLRHLAVHDLQNGQFMPCLVWGSLKHLRWQCYGQCVNYTTTAILLHNDTKPDVDRYLAPRPLYSNQSELRPT